VHEVQAARGTSLSRRAFALAAIVLMIDQGAKAVALASLDPGERIGVFPGLIDFTLQRNAGAALGAGAGYTIVLSLVAVVVVIAVVRLARRLRDGLWAIGLGLLLGGALGNLVDRFIREPGILRGRVIDFIDYDGFFVGNVADLALTVAAAVIAWQSWRGQGIDGLRR
jgi:signal peptidase II